MKDLEFLEVRRYVCICNYITDQLLSGHYRT